METGLNKISTRDLREILTKGRMSHDAMWLMHSIEEFDMQPAKKLNIAAVRSMSILMNINVALLSESKVGSKA